jgi:cellulose synthase/poly-beta-1,6-N-acetylglucosamine synthase-like glycosyltransferase
MKNQFIPVTAPGHAGTYIGNINHESGTLTQQPAMAPAPKPTMYRWIFGIWLLAICWFEPRLFQLFQMANSPLEIISILLFIIFIDIAWLYGIYNLGVISFAVFYKLSRKKNPVAATVMATSFPEVAMLYTTCNDFVEHSAQSCLEQDYPNFRMYILDDSSDQEFRDKIDAFAAQDPARILVVRRPDRKGFKAGNLNHALTHVANEEKYFAIADADEILPADFLSKLVPLMEKDPLCGFIQANHRANPGEGTSLQHDMGVGIDTHWKWYQPLRNEYGFVMFLGHGALLRYECWKITGGFPDIVSEDLGFAIAIREKGYKGHFEESVTCYEDFPDTVRSFRIRHMKWTRGTCEFLHKKMGWLLRAKNISWTEKADILFPTLNLPLTLVFFLFMINTNILMPYLFGHTQPLTMVYNATETIIPVIEMDKGFSVIYGIDFYLITLLTFISPVLCFLIAMRRTPGKLFRFLSYSTALYAALSILSAIGVIAYLISGKAIFLVTGDKNQLTRDTEKQKKGIFKRIINAYRQLINRSHPDSGLVQVLELLLAAIFLVAAIKMMQVSFLGLCLAFAFLPLFHHLGWERKISRFLLFIPFVLIISGMIISGLSIFGMQSVFFGYGFHF